ncbi:MAG: hypothetical protein QOF09_4437 [Alphaproteobacteria bacterium]|jgi:hypothetical protein|nr:hypothetical protein [Alphaproteobacteria bacterium]
MRSPPIVHGILMTAQRSAAAPDVLLVEHIGRGGSVIGRPVLLLLGEQLVTSAWREA